MFEDADFDANMKDGRGGGAVVHGASSAFSPKKNVSGGGGWSNHKMTSRESSPSPKGRGQGTGGLANADGRNGGRGTRGRREVARQDQPAGAGVGAQYKSKSLSPRPTKRNPRQGAASQQRSGNYDRSRGGNSASGKKKSKSKSPVPPSRRHRNRGVAHFGAAASGVNVQGPPADMTVVINRVDVLDGAAAVVAAESRNERQFPILYLEDDGSTRRPKKGAELHHHQQYKTHAHDSDDSEPAVLPFSFRRSSSIILPTSAAAAAAAVVAAPELVPPPTMRTISSLSDTGDVSEGYYSCLSEEERGDDAAVASLSVNQKILPKRAEAWGVHTLSQITTKRATSSSSTATDVTNTTFESALSSEATFGSKFPINIKPTPALSPSSKGTVSVLRAPYEGTMYVPAPKKRPKSPTPKKKPKKENSHSNSPSQNAAADNSPASHHNPQGNSEIDNSDPTMGEPHQHQEVLCIMDSDVPNPHDPSIVHDKYWAQRRRLFSKFDRGIKLDAEGWYSVTPEAIADHVAEKVGEIAVVMKSHGAAGGGGNADGLGWTGLYETPNPVPVRSKKGIVILDAFCGCGGNSIAFAKIPSSLISLVVCVDLTREKLRKAAHNAAIYGIPKDKLLFVQGDTLQVLGKHYRNGERVMENNGETIGLFQRKMNQSTYGAIEEEKKDVDVARNDSEQNSSGQEDGTERHAGFLIGGPEILPPHIDAVFMDPPWGGVDYNQVGKNAYDLEKHMRIYFAGNDDGRRNKDGSEGVGTSVSEVSTASSAEAALVGHHHHSHENGDLSSESFSEDDQTAEGVKVTFPVPQSDVVLHEKDYVDGVDLLRLAARATATRLVLYDLPRNTNKTSLGKAALAAGYRGNIKLDEHFLNGRLKTVTAYLGCDHRSLLH